MKVSNIRNRGISRFWAQKIGIKILMKFTRFIVYSLLKNHETHKFQKTSSIF